MDPLEAAFNAMHVQEAQYARLEASAPWGLSTRGIDGTARFGLVVRGRALLTMPAQPHPVALMTGDSFVIPHGLPYTLCDDLGSPTVNCIEVVRQAGGRVIELGGGGEATSIVSGWFRFDPAGAQPLLNLLPPLLHVRLDHERTHLLQVALQLLSLETAEQRPASGLVVSHLADIVFVHAVREHIASLDPQHSRGWLAALADKRIGAALRLMHGDVAQAWSVDRLAREVGMSRSAFALRFREKVGVGPIEYLTQWRMFSAGQRLRTSDRPAGALAAELGYESEAAFNRAFKRATGLSPGRYRREMQATPA